MIWLLLGLGLFIWSTLYAPAVTTGWLDLAKRYRRAPLPAGEVYTNQVWLEMNRPRWPRQVAWASVSSDGLGLRPEFQYRLTHPPLLIPWSAMTPVGAGRMPGHDSYTLVLDGLGQVKVGPLLFEAMRPFLSNEPPNQRL